MVGRSVSLPGVRRFCTSLPRQALKSALNVAPKEHSCGIRPWAPPELPPPPPPTILPEMLIRPPCMPGQKRGEIQTCLKGQEGLYCPPCKLKYKYPPFSENIDFMPLTVQPPCWWRHPPSCELDEEEDKLASITRRPECSHDAHYWSQ